MSTPQSRRTTGRRSTAAPSQPESNGHPAGSPSENGIHDPSTNGTPMTTTATPPTVTGTPVAPTGPILPETNTGTGNIVADLGRVVQQAKDRLKAIEDERTEAQKKADAEKAKIDQQAEAERLRLEQEEENLRQQLASVGVVFNTPAAPAARRVLARPVTAGRIGRPKGSKNKPKATAAPAATGKKAGGKKKRNTGGMTAPELTLSLVIDADGPVPLAEIRRHLRANGKMSNASVVTDGMVNKGQLKRTATGFTIGKAATAAAAG